MTDQTDETVRPLREGDVARVAELFRQTWLGGLPQEEGSLTATLVLAGYLSEHEWGLVAERDGALLGAILAGLRESDQSARWTGLGRDALARAGRIDPALPGRLRADAAVEAEEARTTRELKARGGLPEADATVQLLLLAPEARGHHLGSRLLGSAKDWMRSRGARGYFLMTDDECDVGFYDHLGLRRMSERTVDDGTRRIGVYAYGELL